ncbi:MAG: TolC family protein [Oligoflexia bacterium]|nr:TolC family protein [Oligoflexia bacterium]
MLRNVLFCFYFLATSPAWSFSIQDAIKTAFEKNPITQANDIRVEAAELRSRAAWLEMLPSVGVHASKNVGKNSNQSDGITTYSRSSSEAWSYGLSFNVFNGGADYYRAKAAEADKNALKATNDSTNTLIPDTKGALASDVLNAYVNLVVNQSYLDLSKKLLVECEKVLPKVIKPDDLSQLKTYITALKNSVTSLEGRVQKDIKTFIYIIKIPPPRLDSLEEIILSLNIPESADKAFQIALENSPDLKIRNYVLESARYNQKAQIANSYLPIVDVHVGRSGYSGEIDNTAGLLSKSNSAAITFSYNWGPATEAYNKATQKEIIAKEKDLEKELERIKHNIEVNNYRELAILEQDKIEKESLTKTVEEEMHKLLERLVTGEDSNIDPRKHIVEFETKKSLEITAKINLIFRKFELQKYIGTLFQDTQVPGSLL